MDRMITLFFGIFLTFYATGTVIGDAISNTVLKNAPPDNYSQPSQEEIEEFCGMNDCPGVQLNITTLDKPPDQVVWTLVAVYSICNVLSVIVCITFLDPLPDYLLKEKKPLKEELGTLLLSVLKVLKDSKMLVLMVFNVHSALYLAFKNADFNRAWVTCSLGIWMVGLVNVPHSVIIAVLSFITGFISKIIGRVIPMIVSIVFGFASFIWLAVWTIDSDDTWVYYTVVSTMAVHSGIVETILMSLHGVLFPDSPEAAYGCYNFFWCLATAITYAYNYYICTDIKVYVLFVSLALASLSFFFLEWGIHKRKIEEGSNDKINFYETDNEVKLGMDNKVFEKERYTVF